MQNFPRIFISHRWSDVEGTRVAEKLYDAMLDHFPADEIFLDSRSDFSDIRTLEAYVISCDVLIIVMGRDWINGFVKGRSSQQDHLLREVEAGIRTDGVVVLPILVNNTRMPTPSEHDNFPDGIARALPSRLGEGVREDSADSDEVDSLSHEYNQHLDVLLKQKTILRDLSPDDSQYDKTKTIVEDKKAILRDLGRQMDAKLANAPLVKKDVEAIAKRIKNRHVRHGGIFRAHEFFSVDTFQIWLNTAQERIRILYTWTSVVGYTRERIIEAMQNNPELRCEILLMHPETEVAKQRKQDSKEDSMWGIRGTISDIVSIVNKLKESNHYLDKHGNPRIEVKIYKSLPYMIAFQVDERMLIGFYPLGGGASNAPYIEVHGQDTTMGEHVVDHFQRVWNQKNNIDGIQYFYDLNSRPPFSPTEPAAD